MNNIWGRQCSSSAKRENFSSIFPTAGKNGKHCIMELELQLFVFEREGKEKVRGISC
jgi:hypothetical protein